MTLQASFAATLVDELVRGGVRHAVVAPGSRSGPLALALAGHPGLRLHVRLDERSAAFFAIGTALASGRPAVMLTTSGTASAEVHAAVLEADLARVPLIVLTADRPPELHHIGAPQTVEQVGIFGRAVRLFVNTGVADESGASSWRSLGARLVAEACASVAGPGPVHANIAFREPLPGQPDQVPPGRTDGEPWHRLPGGPGASPASIAALLDAAAGRRGMIVAGGGAAAAPPSALVSFANALGWPILAEPRSQLRVVAPGVVAHADGIARSELARRALAPEVVLRVGAPHASKVLAGWLGELGRSGVEEILVDPFGSFEDPERRASLVLRAEPGLLLGEVAAKLGGSGDESQWRTRWRQADELVETQIAALLADDPALNEPAIARAVFAAMPDDGLLVCSSSMPIRDVEWYAAPRSGSVRVLANRGANGIDGVTSTILGAAAASSAAAGGAVVGLIGDLAFLHDCSGLVWGRHEARPPATLVLIDNGGGGIFDFLDYPDSVEAPVFERLFGTPQQVDLGALCAGFGIDVQEVTDPAALSGALESAIDRDELSVLWCRTDRERNVMVHRALSERTVSALDAHFA